jgi:hypothetical protein
MTLPQIIVTAILTLGLNVAYLPAAEEEHQHGKTDHDHEKRVEVAIPDSANALWSEIDTRQKSLAELIAAKQGTGLHEAAETLEALVAAIASKYPGLPQDKLKRVEGQTKNAVRLLDEVHQEGEEGHWEDASKKLKQVETAIGIIKSQVNP